MAARHSHKILKHLRRNSRTTLAAIARKERLAISTVFDHVRSLEESPIIRHTSLLDYPKAGYPFRTFFYLDTDEHQETIDYCKGHRNTNSVFSMSGGKLGLDMIFSSLQEEEQFRESLEERGCEVAQHKVLEPVLIEHWTPSE